MSKKYNPRHVIKHFVGTLEYCFDEEEDMEVLHSEASNPKSFTDKFVKQWCAADDGELRICGNEMKVVNQLNEIRTIYRGDEDELMDMIDAHCEHLKRQPKTLAISKEQAELIKKNWNKRYRDKAYTRLMQDLEKEFK